MDEDTTTVPVEPAETGAQPAQPVEPDTTQPADVQTDADPSETTEDAETTTGPSEVDAKLQKYAASQGIDLDSPSAIKAATIAMKAQSEATRQHRQKSELESSLSTQSDEYAEQVAEATGQDPEVLKRLQRMEVKEAVRDFWSQDGRDRSIEPQMISILAERPHLAGDLDALYALAERSSGAATRSQASKDTLKKLAHAQQAAVPTGNATNSGTAPKKKAFGELSIAEMEAQLGFVRR